MVYRRLPFPFQEPRLNAPPDIVSRKPNVIMVVIYAHLLFQEGHTLPFFTASRDHAILHAFHQFETFAVNTIKTPPR